MTAVLAPLLDWWAWFMICYFTLLNTSFLLLSLLAAREFVGHARRAPFAGYEEAFTSPLTPPISVLMPAYNESAGIVQSLSAMSTLRYPEFEVVVIDDGSTDGTLEVLISAFDLVRVPAVIPAQVPTKRAVESVWRSKKGGQNIVVVRKANGGKADALNVGINVARYPLICMVDADSLLDPDALLHVSRPFADDPQHVVATGGVVRVANGCKVRSGRVESVRMPHRWLARVQVVEYLRAFLIGRSGWSGIGALLIISGAFGLFRRDLLIEVGGMAYDSIGEDAELVVRLHRRMAERRVGQRVVFVAEPVVWTEVPQSQEVLRAQRRRWQRGITEILLRHRRMILNPRYGMVGLVAMPWFVLFELLAPFVELLGLAYLAFIGTQYVVDVTGVAPSDIDLELVGLLLAVAWGYALLISLVAIALEELSFRRYDRPADLVTAVAATVLENVWFRQMTAWWRVQGSVQALRGSPQVWGTMTRAGFSLELPAPARSAPRAPTREPTPAP